DAVDDHRRAVQLFFHVDLVDDLDLPAGREDDDLAVLGADVDLTVDIIGRTPDAGLEVVDPLPLPGAGIKAVHVAGLLGDVDQAVVDGAGADGRGEIDLALTLGRLLDRA